MRRALVLACALAALSARACAPSAKPRSAPQPAQAPLGRLFFTPTERAQLDVARMQKKAPAQQRAAAEPVEAPPAPQVVTYGGIVRRSDGRAMLWLNNRLVDEKEALAGLSLKGKVRPDGAVTLQVPQTGGSIDVKVGQSVELQTGRVAEARKPPPEASNRRPRKNPSPAAGPPQPRHPSAAATPAPAAAAEAAHRKRREKSRRPAQASASRWISAAAPPSPPKASA